MSKLELPPEVADALQREAKARGCSPSELLAGLLGLPTGALRDHPLAVFTASPEFRAKFSDADRYLALLAWVAREHGAEFAEFIAHQASGRRYLGLSPEEIRETCRHNQARPIPGTRFWAIMNLDTPTKRRFLRRLLVFCGYRDEVIDHACAQIGGRGG